MSLAAARKRGLFPVWETDSRTNGRMRAGTGKEAQVLFWSMTVIIDITMVFCATRLSYACDSTDTTARQDEQVLTSRRKETLVRIYAVRERYCGTRWTGV